MTLREQAVKLATMICDERWVSWAAADVIEAALLAAEQRALREAAEAMYKHFGLDMVPEYYLWLQARADSLSSPVRDGETKQPGKR